MALGRRGKPAKTAAIAVQHQRDGRAGWPVLIAAHDVHGVRNQCQADMAELANAVASGRAPYDQTSRRREVQWRIGRPKIRW